jgi:hypothetical protein
VPQNSLKGNGSDVDTAPGLERLADCSNSQRQASRLDFVDKQRTLAVMILVQPAAEAGLSTGNQPEILTGRHLSVSYSGVM